MPRFARVALAIPVRRLFEYRIPDSLGDRLGPGVRVRVPFHGRQRVGYCVEVSDVGEHPRPKDITAVLDEEPVLDAELLDLVSWTADYYLTSVGEVIEAALPKGVRDPRPRQVSWARRIDPDRASDPEKNAEPERGAGRETREAILEFLVAGPRPVSAVKQALGVTDSPVKTLAKHGRLELYKAPALVDDHGAALPQSRPAPTLTDDQAGALDGLFPAVDGPRFETFLLHGVTGSGKTEIYLQTIERALAAERGALVLLPEIALTSQTVARFEERVGRVAVLHSMLADQERARMHRSLADGDLRVAIGARSAIFAPVRDLGIIIVDESHESSYKQESNPRYHARDLAVLRASRRGIPCLLGTATPTLESLENAKQGRFTRIRLPRRVTAHPLATIEIVDRRGETPDRKGRIPLLSRRLVDVTRQALDRGGQAIFFLNRRGFARNIHCNECGFALRCDSCDIGLTYHKHAQRSMCHYCGIVRPLPETCPDCSSPGIRRSHPGTERIEEVLAECFPKVTVDRLDRDTATTRDRMEAILDRFRSGETRVLVGTQMVAKGHDIPGVTLVGVVDADIALNLPDFRAAERTAQLICQVAGRAGRGEEPGRVVIQTRQPDHYAIESGRRQDLEYLYDQEAATRRLLAYPPFGYLVRLVCEDHVEERAVAAAAELGRRLRASCHEGVQILGPAPAPLARLRSWYRVHLLVKGKSRGALRATVERAIHEPVATSTTRVVVDVDPQSLL